MLVDEFNVRIEHLEPMRVAYTTAFSESPELDAWNALVAWAKPKGLLNDLVNRRLYGFNNPDPTPGKAEYGYEVLITIDDDTEPEGEIKVREFPGGLYAVTSCRGASNITKTWQRFVEWCKASEYDFGRHQWLERHITLPDPEDLEAMELDLYMPIAE